MEQRRANVFDSLVEVESEFGDAEDTLLFLKELAEALKNFVLCFDLVDGVGLHVLLQLQHSVLFLVEHSLLRLRPLHHHVIVIVCKVAILLLQLFLHPFELTDDALGPLLCLISLCYQVLLILDFHGLRAPHVSDEALHEIIELPVEVNVDLDVLRLPLTVAKFLRRLRQQR